VWVRRLLLRLWLIWIVEWLRPREGEAILLPVGVAPELLPLGKRRRLRMCNESSGGRGVRVSVQCRQLD
jgi:hypothetical protein